LHVGPDIATLLTCIPDGIQDLLSLCVRGAFKINVVMYINSVPAAKHASASLQDVLCHEALDTTAILVLYRVF